MRIQSVELNTTPALKNSTSFISIHPQPLLTLILTPALILILPLVISLLVLQLVIPTNLLLPLPLLNLSSSSFQFPSPPVNSLHSNLISIRCSPLWFVAPHVDCPPPLPLLI